ncbi:MAG: hypothetical protein U5L45_09930 [Saprospiraceae bacterium]|nr:hypothetical protein [Saprospiraceae bacterium]
MLASLAKEGDVVHFSGFARKMNNISLFCERSSAAKGFYISFL